MRVEIKEVESEVIDWSKSQLVVCISDDTSIILTSGDSHKNVFTGVVVSKSNVYDFGIGKRYNEMQKRHFKPFKGVITLQND